METLIEAIDFGSPAARPIISCREDALKLMKVWNSCDLFGSSRFCTPGFGQDDNPKLFSLPRAALVANEVLVSRPADGVRALQGLGSVHQLHVRVRRWILPLSVRCDRDAVRIPVHSVRIEHPAGYA